MDNSQLIQGPDAGLNYLVPENALNPRAAANGSYNVIYDRGLFRCANGFDKVDLTTTGLNSGEDILQLFGYNELDGASHLLAVTNSKIYEHNVNLSMWTDRTGSGNALAGNLNNAVTYTTIAHDGSGDSAGTGANGIHLDNNANKPIAYYHSILCDGGNSDILRWAGRKEGGYLPLTMTASDYHDGTTHRARAVASYQNRLILISPLIYSSSTKIWSAEQTQQRVQYPMLGKLQTWTGTGSGFVDLIDTGGTNITAGLLGGQLIVYQTNGIWTLRYVGGTAIFSPYPYIADIGIIGPQGVVNKNNIHYFVGRDYNVYAYHGGSTIKPIGDAIRDKLEEEINPIYEGRTILTLDEERRRLWLYVITGTHSLINTAYAMDLRTGVWTKKDVSCCYNGNTTGVTAVSLIGSQSYVIGDTYQNALDQQSLYDASSTSATDTTEISDMTIRLGDTIMGDTTANNLDWSVFDWTTDGLDFTGIDWTVGGLAGCFTTVSTDCTEFFCQTEACGTSYSGNIIRIDDGSDSGNTPIGTSFFTVGDISATANAPGYNMRFALEPQDTTGLAWADASTNTPSVNSVGTDTSGTLFCPSGTTYNDVLEDFLVSEQVHKGDTAGFVYRYDFSTYEYAGQDISSLHITPTYDFQRPDIVKRWKEIDVVAQSPCVASYGLKFEQNQPIPLLGYEDSTIFHFADNVPWSLSFWMFSETATGSSPTSSGTIFSTADGFFSGGVAAHIAFGSVLLTLSDGIAGFEVWNPAAGNSIGSEPAQWRHYVVTYDGSVFSVYLNGVKLSYDKTDFGLTATADTTETPRLGAGHQGASSTASRLTNARLSDFRFWHNQVITSSEAKAMYGKGQGAKYTGTISEGGAADFVLKLDEGDGTTVRESISDVTTFTIDGSVADWDGDMVWTDCSLATTGALEVFYDIDDGGWIHTGHVPGSRDYKETPLYINKSGKRLKLKFSGSACNHKVREFQIIGTQPKDDR
jgi:hypothetical protein